MQFDLASSACYSAWSWIEVNTWFKCVFCRDVTVGDIVTVGECRPLSKTVRFNVLKVTKAAGAKKQFQKF